MTLTSFTLTSVQAPELQLASRPLLCWGALGTCLLPFPGLTHMQGSVAVLPSTGHPTTPSVPMNCSVL